MDVQFRSAHASDVDAVVPLIYGANDIAFDYAFGLGQSNMAKEFLLYAFQDGKGFYGWRNHTVALVAGRVVGVGAFYSGDDYLRLRDGLVPQIARFYPLNSISEVVSRGLQLKMLMPPPSEETYYVAHLGVDPAYRCHGVGSALLRHQEAVGELLGRKIFALDVAITNRRAQLLYERLGFHAVHEHRFPGPRGMVANTCRMEMAIA